MGSLATARLHGTKLLLALTDLWRHRGDEDGTDLSKGAMPVECADLARVGRYDSWYGLLQKEIDLVATPNPGIVAISNVVARHLKRRRFPRPFVPANLRP